MSERKRARNVRLLREPFTRHLCTNEIRSDSGLSNETQNTGNDQIDCDNVVQEPRHEQNEYASDQGKQRLMNGHDRHFKTPFHCPRIICIALF